VKRSTDRILTTHVGSLPRPEPLLKLLEAKTGGKPVDAAAWDSEVHDSVVDVVRRQSDLGVDIVNDGEYGKPSFVNYINDRLTGLEARGIKGSSWRGSKEEASFPDFYAALARSVGGAFTAKGMYCVGPLKYAGHEAAKKELALFKEALGKSKPVEAFVSALSINNASDWITNDYYKTEEEYLTAIADAMHEEYKLIVDAGFILQVDDPQLATIYMRKGQWTIEDYKRWADARVEFLNYSLRDIPTEKIRFHTCYSINIGPRLHDLELKHFLDIMLRVRAGAYSFEAANPRHEHEWHLWEGVKLPEGTSILPGVISHATILVEHPELVAERIVRFANAVGRENVIASADCGFASFAISKDTQEMPHEVVWEKFKSLAEGARIASKQLWGR
jgi:5-methyltetrahydropteroyltriglutamate--homocysteine methyltransferase